mmetsp:Transcript_1029/g.1194  ORF Transcript_1029/g.1194 Transcript_1029/m.1194 type:complete len:323 (-) Transcript_1029:223-1191(-)
MAAAGWTDSNDGSFVSNSTGMSYYPTSEYWLIDSTKYVWGKSLNVETMLAQSGFSREVLRWSRDNYWHAYVTACLYILLVFLGKRLMATRGAFDLRRPLKYWNLLLAAFSIWGSLRLIPHMLTVAMNFDFTTALCTPPAYTIGHGTTSVWVVMFMLSKYAELVDTGFIVLRKKNLSFLHWYHHATVLAYTWDAVVREQGVAVFYCLMNYFVHSVMYTYYFLASAMKRPPRWGMLVTVLQITQMIIGVGLTVYGIILANTTTNTQEWSFAMAANPIDSGVCFVHFGNMLGACLMYSTYFYLFAEFFAKRYLFKAVEVRVKKSE